jgi:hypothetical protein
VTEVEVLFLQALAWLLVDERVEETLPEPEDPDNVAEA